MNEKQQGWWYYVIYNDGEPSVYWTTYPPVDFKVETDSNSFSIIFAEKLCPVNERYVRSKGDANLDPVLSSPFTVEINGFEIFRLENTELIALITKYQLTVT